MNLFTSTQRMAAGSVENHLTEFVAAALILNHSFRRRFGEILLTNRPFALITTVETQVDYPHGCCPDMRLVLGDGRVILCENKIEAVETSGKDHNRGQLERYLDLPVDGVAYIRGSWKPPAHKVLNHPKYIKPTTREHFLWRDFYNLLEGDVFFEWLRQGFEGMGYTPLLPSIGDLSDPDRHKKLANQREFAKLWILTRSNLKQMGWRTQIGSRIELYLDNKSSKWSQQIFISPYLAERFLIRVTPRPGYLQEIFDAAKDVSALMSLQPTVEVHKIRRKDGLTEVVDIQTSLFNVLRSASTADEMEQALWSFVGKFVKEIK